MRYEMPHKGDKKKLYAAVATLPCQCCGAWGVQVSHSNQSKDGKGMGLKSYPYRIAALCPACHVEIDSGKHLTKAERIEKWDEAHIKTIQELFRRKLIQPLIEKFLADQWSEDDRRAVGELFAIGILRPASAKFF